MATSGGEQASGTPVADDLVAWRRATLWGLLGAKLIAGWGVQWDIQWHVLIGRDSFWIAPHVMTYAGVTLAVLLSFGTLVRETAARIPGPRVLGLAGTRGFHGAAWGIAVTVLAAPVDDLWHRLFGLDVTLWSPPHLMGILGAAINGAACLLIAREVYPAGSRMRWLALVIAGALLYGTLHLTIDPAIRIAYVHGGVRFHAYAILAALVLPLALVPATRLSGRRVTPVLVILVLLPVGVIGNRIARAGFAWLQPVSVIEKEVTRDPTSPIAVAHAIARKNGTMAGQGGGVLRFLGLVPVAVMALADPRRRPVVATVGYALTLFAVAGWVLAHRPAFAVMAPGGGDTVLALGLTLAAAGMGGWLGHRLADALTEAAPDGLHHTKG